MPDQNHRLDALESQVRELHGYAHSRAHDLANRMQNMTLAMERFARIETLLEGLDERMDKWEKRIWGNGQPGELTKIQTRVDQVESAVETHPLKCDARLEIAKLAADIAAKNAARNAAEAADEKWHKRLEPYFSLAFRGVVVVLLLLLVTHPETVKALMGH